MTDCRTSADTACSIVRELEIASARLGTQWVTPHRSLDYDSNTVSLEWWVGVRKLTLFVTNISTDYLISWGPNIFNEMEEGHVGIDKSLEQLWQWLNHDGQVKLADLD